MLNCYLAATKPGLQLAGLDMQRAANPKAWTRKREEAFAGGVDPAVVCVLLVQQPKPAGPPAVLNTLANAVRAKVAGPNAEARLLQGAAPLWDALDSA